jgi:uracil-DNA glycosylase family 4
VAWREEIAGRKVARHRACDYWGRPVPGYGDAKASILVVGLAPGAHGANRTGRVFTGDRSGDFLYAALHRAGLANQPTSLSVDDGLVLRGVYIGLAVRCAPPGNAPAPGEIARCAHFLDDEIAALPHLRAVLALGAIAWRAALDHAARAGVTLPRPRPAFAHGARADFARGAKSSPPPPLFGSYHVSQQNTQTGKLTPSMLDEVLRQVLRAASA